jgi:5-formyltetrahydrofolate cyclo-ligase
VNFADKASARQAVWDRLVAERLARFPFPTHGRIPNFAGAAEAAKRLFDWPVLRDAKRIKVNPDSPQRYVRIEALRRGITVYVPTPRLKGGFKKLDPARISYEEIPAAAALSKGDEWAEPVALADMPQLDAIVTGCVAVTRGGKRTGKGEGYSDIEYAILRELGHRPVPVATTVHPVQIVDDFPIETNDLPLACIATPDELFIVARPPPAPERIEWARLSDEDIAEMPILADLKRALAGHDAARRVTTRR